MSSVQPVNYGYVPNGSNKHSVVTVPSSGKENRPLNSDIINCTDLYSQKEIKKILKRVGTEAANLPLSVYAPRYTVQYYSKSDSLVINNVTRTNDTTEILSDGSVRSVGSWHNKEVAPAGSCNDILIDAKNRIRETLTH